MAGKGKDPAALFFIDKWLVATKEMKADCRGWFLNLILHQYDKKDLPNDIEELANLADVRISEFPLFQQVFQQVLKNKFEENANGRLENVFAREILQAREVFKNKREAAGRMSAFIKHVRKNLCQDENILFYIKQNVDLSEVDLNNKQVLEHMFKQLLQLYINVNVNTNINKEEKGVNGEKEGTPPPNVTIDPGVKVLLVPEMLAIWRVCNPEYVTDPQNDFAPLRTIGENIAKANNIKNYVGMESVEKIKAAWTVIVNFIVKDDHFKNYQLSQVAKYYNNIVSKLKNSIKEKDKSGIVENNMSAANEAMNLLKQKHSTQ